MEIESNRIRIRIRKPHLRSLIISNFYKNYTLARAEHTHGWESAESAEFPFGMFSIYPILPGDSILLCAQFGPYQRQRQQSDVSVDVLLVLFTYNIYTLHHIVHTMSSNNNCLSISVYVLI